MEQNFWENKTLDEMSDQEWEAICDGCGKCCLQKVIDDSEEKGTTDYINDGETIYFTSVVCQYLNTKQCACTCYKTRTVLVPDCVKLTKENLSDVFYMPPSCSYRRLQEGRGLPSWHPLLNKGKKTAMHRAGMSVRGKTVSDAEVDLEDYVDYIAYWPTEDLD
nr:YcgN family cysteine cluster protein [Algicola sagamiensis]